MKESELKEVMDKLGSEFTKMVNEDPSMNSIIVHGVMDGHTFSMLMGHPMSIVCSMTANMKEDEQIDKIMKHFIGFVKSKEEFLGTDA